MLPPLPPVKKLIEIPQNVSATKSSTKAKNQIYIGAMAEVVAWFCRCAGVEDAKIEAVFSGYKFFKFKHILW